MNLQNVDLAPQKDLSIFKDTMVEMTWPEIKQCAERGDIVLFPIGIIEEHGPHMDLSPDVYLAYFFCKNLKQVLANKGIHSIVAPPSYWGVSEDVKSIPGTFSIRPEIFKELLIDLFSSLRSWGFEKVFIVNSHGDGMHVQSIDQAVSYMQEQYQMQIFRLSNWDVTVEDSPAFPAPREGSFQPDVHAGANETAAMYTIYPQKVKTEIARTLKPQSEFFPLGYCGDPASYHLEKDVIAFFEADLETDALRIEAYLKKAGENASGE